MKVRFCLQRIERILSDDEITQVKTVMETFTDFEQKTFTDENYKLVGEISSTTVCNPQCPSFCNTPIKYCTNRLLLSIYKGDFDSSIYTYDDLKELMNVHNRLI